MKVAILIPFLIIPIACAKKNLTVRGGESFAAVTSEGNEGANGGTTDAQQIVQLSGELLAVVRQSEELFPELKIEDFAKAVEQTRVFVVNDIVIDGHELDASNNGIDEIDVNLLKWKTKGDRLEKLALLMHEYLGILGLERGTYAISKRLLNPLSSLSSPTTFQCDKQFIRMNVRHDSTSDLFFFSYAGMDKDAYLKTYGESASKDEVDREGYAWEEEFCHEKFPVRRKELDALINLSGCDPVFTQWDQMRFLDGRGILFSNSKNHDQMICKPLN